MAPTVFTGSLLPKKKQELQEIAAALNIGDQGTKDDIINRINRHLELNPDLEEDPSFTGLFGNRRRRSVQPQIPAVQSLPKPNSRGRRVIPQEPIRESTPVNDLRDVSMFLKTAASPYEDTPQQSPRQALDMTPSSLPALPLSAPVSPAKSIIEHLPTSKDVEILTARIKVNVERNELLQNSLQTLEQLREFLSSSSNIWRVTFYLEFVYVLYKVVPWKTGDIPLFEYDKTPITVPYFYPPLSTFETFNFWVVLFHWIAPAFAAPWVAGKLISFAPRAASHPTNPTGSKWQSDHLTAAIIRLAIQVNYSYAWTSVQNAEVLGWHWRVWTAAVGLLLAFSERLAASPQATAEIIQIEQRKEKLQLPAPPSATQSPSTRRRALMPSASTEFADEVD